jgi:hypothetical protein
MATESGLEYGCSYALIELLSSFIDRPYFVVSWGPGIFGKNLMRVRKATHSLQVYGYKDKQLVISFPITGYWYVQQFPELCGLVNKGEINGLRLQFIVIDVIPPASLVKMEIGPPDYMSTMWTIAQHGVMTSQIFPVPPKVLKRPAARKGGAEEVSPSVDISGIKMLLKFLMAFED